MDEQNCSRVGYVPNFADTASLGTKPNPAQAECIESFNRVWGLGFGVLGAWGSMQNGITCTIFNSIEPLRAVAPEWRALWLDDPHTTPFQSPEWLLSWAHQFGPSDLRTVLAYDRGSLAAILPFYRHLDPQTEERQLLLLGAGTSDYLDGIYSSSCSESHIREALGMICCEDDWDTLRVFQLRERSMLRQVLEHLPLPGLRRIGAESCLQIPAVPLDGLPRSIRDQAKHYRNCALRQGNLELLVAGEDNWSTAFDALERLHTSRWRNSGQPGLLADTRVVAWHREALPLLLRSGMLRLFTLSLNGEPIAVLYSLLDPPSRSPRMQYFYLTAFSIQHADLRPGTVLTALAVEHAANEGVRTIDMLRGDEPYKRLWHPEKLPTYGFSMPWLKRSSSMLHGAHAGQAAA